MPPKGKPRPAANESKALTDWIDGQVAAAETARNALQGRVVMRRLNRAEYENTVRDLLGVDVDLKDVLPDDTVAGGFDNSAETLHVSSYLMESYLEAADRVLDAAIASGPRPAQVNDASTSRRSPPRGGRRLSPPGRRRGDFQLRSRVNIQIMLWNFRTRDRGKYRFRISAYAYQTEKPVIFHVNGGTNDLGDPPYLIGYFDVPPPEKPTVVEFVEQMEAGRNIRILVDTEVTPPEPRAQWRGGELQRAGPGRAVGRDRRTAGRLLAAAEPSPAVRRPAAGAGTRQSRPPRGRLEATAGRCRAILRNFTRRAFRRAVTDEDIKPFLARVRAKLDEKYSFEQALRVGLKAVLVSPHFLFLRESVRPAGNSGSPGDLARPAALDDFALASRLSYFLWSSMPDEELLELAEQGKLSQPETLREQVERMLRDPKAEAFTENFAGQWLGLRDIDATLPDRQLYPEYDDILRSRWSRRCTCSSTKC